MLGVLVSLIQGPPVAIPCSNQAVIPGMMSAIHKCLSLPPNDRFSVVGLGSTPALSSEGIAEVPVNLIPIHLIGSAQIVDFRLNEDGVWSWVPFELARVEREGGKE